MSGKNSWRNTGFWLILWVLWPIQTISGQEVDTTDAKSLLERVSQDNDTLYVVNFWATWCAPCVEELHLFNTPELSKKHQPIKIILVSLDFKNQIDSKLKPFLSARDIKETVLWLNEKNPNAWVDLVDPSWSGAIPATKIYYKKQDVFKEGELNAPELENLIESVL